MLVMRILWVILHTFLTYFILSEARPGQRAASSLSANDSSISSFHPNSTKAVFDTSVPASSTKVSETSAPSTTHVKVISSNISSTAFRPLSTSAADASSSSLPSSTRLGPSPQVTPASTNAGVWNYRNSLFGTTFIQTGIPPAITYHNGLLYVLYTDRASNNLYFAFGNNDNFGTPIPVTDENGLTFGLVANTQAAALASFNGILHTVFQQDDRLKHLMYNDTTQVWTQQYVFDIAYRCPTLAVYNGQLYLAMLGENEIFSAFWLPLDGWSDIYTVAGGVNSWGSPALYAQETPPTYNLLMLFPQNNSNRRIQSLIYDYPTNTWSTMSSTPPESTAFGVSATYSEEMAFMGFQENANSGNVYVSVYSGSWANHEDTGQSSHDTPSLAVLDGVVNVIFDSNNGNRDILWTQRSLKSYSLESWMSVIDSGTYLSALSIPGTHDSVAVSSVKLVACQTMSITEQLDAGIRFLDLRSGVWNNVLYMYHGELYRLNPPDWWTLQSIIQEIQQWLSTHSSETVIASIKQDAGPISSTISFASAVSQLINQNPGLWSIASSLPISLGDVRGKIQLMRRYTVDTSAGEQAIGVDLTDWPDNNSNFQIFTPSGPTIYGQDQYSFDEGLAEIISNKWTLVLYNLEQAIYDEDSTSWYLNFMSATDAIGASNFNPFTDGPIYPEDIACGDSCMNYQLRYWIYQQPLQQRYGTILMDFPETPENDLIASIIASNM